MHNVIRRNQRGEQLLPNNWMNFLNEVFDDKLSTNFEGSFNGSKPPVNIIDGDSIFKVEIIVPGLNKTDFELGIDNNILTVNYKIEPTKDEGSEKFTHHEFKLESFKRTFTLPKTINQDEITAEYKDGILNISLPKNEEAKAKEARKVSIQ